MNVPIYRLFLVFLVLFAVLIGFTSRWAVFGEQRLRENPDNARVRIEEQQIKRGVIRAANREVLAGSTRLSGDRYGRRYPTGRLFALPGRLRRRCATAARAWRSTTTTRSSAARRSCRASSTR